MFMTETFRNQQFLVNEGLNPQNVLDYFYESPFYIEAGGPTSLNEQQRRGQQVDIAQPGEWFELVFSNDEGKSGFVDESIFVIQKFQKTHAAKKLPREVFYVLSGTVAAAPGLGLLLERIAATTAVNFAEIYRLVRDARQVEKPTAKKENGHGWPDFVIFEENPKLDLNQAAFVLKDELSTK
jgi:hypothetical protein